MLPGRFRTQIKTEITSTVNQRSNLFKQQAVSSSQCGNGIKENFLQERCLKRSPYLRQQATSLLQTTTRVRRWTSERRVQCLATSASAWGAELARGRERVGKIICVCILTVEISLNRKLEPTLLKFSVVAQWVSRRAEREILRGTRSPTRYWVERHENSRNGKVTIVQIYS